MEQHEVPASEGIWSPRPKNWLVESILVTIFCCLPFGIVGIIYAAQVNTKFDLGDYLGATRMARDARKWTLISLIVGGGWIILLLGFGLFSSFFFGMHHWFWPQGGF